MLCFRFASSALLLTFSVALASSCGGNPGQSAEEPEGGGGGGAVSPTAGSGPAGHANGGAPWVGLGGRGDGGSTDAPEECARATARAELVPANFLFVIDSSGSMNCNPPDGDAALAARCARYPTKEDPSRPSKWEITKSALRSALEVLVDRPHVSAGVALFPHETECGVAAAPSVPIAPLGADQLTHISSALDSADPRGETPVAGATILSYAHLAERLRAGTLSGNSFVILLTDGAETCAPAVLDPLVSRDVPNARLFDIRTFVIGAPGSEAARALLSTVAWEGGTAAAESCSHDPRGEGGDCHLDMTSTDDFEGALERALLAITSTEALSCELNVPENPDGGVDLDRVNVSFTPAGGEPEQIGNDDASCAEANGWQYSADGSKIVLCGDACRRVRAGNGELSIVLGCPTIKVR